MPLICYLSTGGEMKDPEEEEVPENSASTTGSPRRTDAAMNLLKALGERETWKSLAAWIGATPRRIVLIGTVTVLLLVAMVVLNFLSQLYARLSPAELYWVGAVKWISIFTAAIVALLSLIYSARGQ